MQLVAGVLRLRIPARRIARKPSRRFSRPPSFPPCVVHVFLHVQPRARSGRSWVVLRSFSSASRRPKPRGPPPAHLEAFPSQSTAIGPRVSPFAVVSRAFVDVKWRAQHVRSSVSHEDVRGQVPDEPCPRRHTSLRKPRSGGKEGPKRRREAWTEAGGASWLAPGGRDAARIGGGRSKCKGKGGELEGKGTGRAEDGGEKGPAKLGPSPAEDPLLLLPQKPGFGSVPSLLSRIRVYSFRPSQSFPNETKGKVGSRIPRSVCPGHGLILVGIRSLRQPSTGGPGNRKGRVSPRANLNHARRKTVRRGHPCGNRTVPAGSSRGSPLAVGSGRGSGFGPGIAPTCIPTNACG